MREVHDINEWLVSNGIDRKWASSVASQIRKQYPALGQEVRSNNRAELELVQLVYHILEGRFPAKRTRTPLV